jgi:hypothetical protein
LQRKLFELRAVRALRALRAVRAKGTNDSSRKIAAITGVIDGISFQTTSLAINAAVTQDTGLADRAGPTMQQVVAALRLEGVPSGVQGCTT